PSAHRVTIAVMGCRVNGPGETDDADLGLWCGPSTVVLKKKDVKVGSFSYSEVLPRLKAELDRLIEARAACRSAPACESAPIGVKHAAIEPAMSSPAARLPKMMLA